MVEKIPTGTHTACEHWPEEWMQAEIGRRKLQMRGNPECGSQLAQGSIHIGSESATSRHEIAAFATSFRHSVLASEALRAPGQSRKHWGLRK